MISRLLTIVAILSFSYLLARAGLFLFDAASRHPEAVAILAAFLAAACLTAIVIRRWASMPWRDR